MIPFVPRSQALRQTSAVAHAQPDVPQSTTAYYSIDTLVCRGRRPLVIEWWSSFFSLIRQPPPAGSVEAWTAASLLPAASGAVGLYADSTGGGGRAGAWLRRLQEAQRLSEEAPDDVGLLVYQPNFYTPDAGFALSVITGRVSIALLRQRLWV